MKVNQKLIDLTNKFLKEFLDCANEDEEKRDDLFHFNFTLAKAIGQSDYPKYKEQHTILMGMASFDDSIAKAFFNNRIQGFVKSIEKRINNCENQEDYLVENIQTKEFEKDDTDFVWTTDENGKRNFSVVPCKTKCQDISFDVKNTRSGFEGSAIIHKEFDKEFVDNNNFEEKFIIKDVDFFCKKERIMTIDYHFDFDNYSYYEEAKFEHYKYIADINSFYFVLAFS